MGEYMDMHIEKRQAYALGAIIILILAAGGWYLYTHRQGPLPDTSMYRGRSFNFIYPRIDEFKEYTSTAVSVGKQVKDVYDPAVEVVLYKNDPDTALPASYEAFVQKQALALCSSDGPAEELSCSAPLSETFVTRSGVTGEKRSFTLTRTNLTSGTTTTMTFAPVYTFNRSTAATADSPLRYAAVFVYPSVPGMLAGTASSQLIDQIVNSLTLPGEVSTVGQPKK